MGTYPFKKGWQKIGKKVFAYLQPDGSWGLNNAGLIVDEGQSLLIDTLYDIPHTREMLEGIIDIAPDFIKVDTVVNTHGDGDHFYGNSLVKDAEIYSTETCLREMQAMPPKKMNMLMNLWFLLGPAGAYAKKAFRDFHYKNIPLVLPNKTFKNKITLTIGSISAELIEIKNTHKEGNIIVYIPEEKIVFTADLLFINAFPLAWSGPIQSWIDGLDTILNLDVTTIVPGHGPIVKKDDVRKVKDFFTFMYEQTKIQFLKGMTMMDTALHIDLSMYKHWSEKERIISVIECIYRELDPVQKKLSPIKLFGMMAKLRKKLI
ncbi:MAG: MBL fold metallo-hydrolase [Spirochaetales bacterium]|nr:MBL fold metallo-hydrolase [Spirochaetales bacterium]